MGHAVASHSEFRNREENTSPKHSTQSDQPTLEALERDLAAEWFKLKRCRHEVGRILKQIRSLLKTEEGKFAEILRSKGIPQSTAYDLIQDYDRWSLLPQKLKDAAVANNVDLAERKYIPVLETVTASNDIEQFDEKDIAELLQFIEEKAKRKTREPFKLPPLDRNQRPVYRAFQSLKAALADRPAQEQAATLTQLLGFVLHALKIKPEHVQLTPEEPPTWVFVGTNDQEGQ
jgi:hypothetical protein